MGAAGNQPRGKRHRHGHDQKVKPLSQAGPMPAQAAYAAPPAGDPPPTRAAPPRAMNKAEPPPARANIQPAPEPRPAPQAQSSPPTSQPAPPSAAATPPQEREPAPVPVATAPRHISQHTPTPPSELTEFLQSLRELFVADRANGSRSDATRCGICYLTFARDELTYREEDGCYLCARCAAALGHQHIPMLRRQRR